MKSTTLRSDHARRSASLVVAPSEMSSGSRLCREPFENCVADILRRAGCDGLTKNELTRRTQFVDHRRRNAVLAAMIEAGEVVATRQLTATKSAIVLRLAEQGEPRTPTTAPNLELAGGTPGAATILALDLGHTTGWALGTPDGGITSGTEEFRQDRWQGGGIKFLKFKRWLTELKGCAGGLDLVVYESVRRHAGLDASHAFGGWLAILTAWCEHHGIPYEGVPVGTIKRHATGKGNADKAAVMAAVRALGFNPQDDNEADALALLNWALANRAEGGVR